mmetsp:Transcript_29638/g.62964  ORF Transcript_29638/g.62964 Transcript_29638/m.62964 type:complete len:106 (+) Transcript_29638:83-400(+)
MPVVMNMGAVKYTRLAEGLLLSLFLLVLSGVALFAFGNFYYMIVVTNASKLGFFSILVDRAFPMKSRHKWEYDLQHVVMFAILVALLSMVQPPVEDENKKKKKRR